MSRDGISRSAGRIAVAAIALLLFSATCGAFDNVRVTAEGSSTIPPGTALDQLLGDIDFLGDLASFDITDSEEFQNQGYTREQIDSVIVGRFTLSISDPPDGNFDFLDEIHFFAESEGLPRVLIASMDPVPVGASSFDLDLEAVELVDYATAESMSITTEASGRRPSEETTVDAEVVLDVNINVSGACRSVF